MYDEHPLQIALNYAQKCLRNRLQPSIFSKFSGGGPPYPPCKRGDTPLSHLPPARAFGTQVRAKREQLMDSYSQVRAFYLNLF